MKNLFRYSFLLLAISLFVFTSCKDDSDDISVNHYDLMTEYMLDNNLDLSNIIGTKGQPDFFVTKAPGSADDIATWAAGYEIFDIRSEDDFTAGHITTAINVKFANILTEATTLGKDAKILLVCYSGQSACYATSLLRLAGFSNAKALKWGMSGWNTTCADHTKGWNVHKGSEPANGHTNWSTGAAPSNETFNYPSFSANATDGASILLERVNAAFTAGFKGVAGTSVLDNPGDYHINNYFNETDYGSSGFGHIDGAFRIQPLTVAGDQIKHLNPDKQVVTYCYTGQTSAIISAYLNVLGYNAVSLKNGMNSLYNTHSHWTSNQWGGDSKPKEYPTVP